ncbi:MAG: hypothetical protein IJ991_14325 [Thermoguttaceae bacterium]|nr:hypothetical protein [Thermoguttaceae bacterium]
MKKRREVGKLSAVAPVAARSSFDGYDPAIPSTTFKFAPLYSGGLLYIDGYDAPVALDLESLRVDPAPKALLNHDFDSVVGRLENVEKRVDPTTGRLALFCNAVVGGCALAERVVAWARDVAAWVPSIGAYRVRDVEEVPVGATALVNRQKFSGPIYVVRGASLCEGSFVPIGGDGDARAILASLKKGRKNPMTFEDWLTQNGRVAAELNETERAELLETFNASGSGAVVASGATDGASEDDDKDDAQASAATSDELQTVVEEAVEQVVDDLPAEEAAAIDSAATTEIVETLVQELADDFEAAPVAAALKATRLARKAVRARLDAPPRTPSTPTPRSDAKERLAESRRVEAIKAFCANGGKDAARAAAKGIAEGWSLDRTRRYLESSTKRRGIVAGLKKPGVGRADAFDGPRRQDVLAASLAITCGMKPDRVQAAFGFDERTVDAAVSKANRNATLRTVVAASNNSFRPGSYVVGTDKLSGYRECRANCRRLAFGAVQAGFSTVSAVDVFSAVMQAFLEEGAQTATPLWDKLAKTNTLADFTAVKSYSPTIVGRLQEIAATGKIEKVSFETKEFTQTAKPNAASFTVPYMMIVNDQIDAFAELVRQFNELPNQCVERDVAGLFWDALDGKALYEPDGKPLVSEERGNLLVDKEGVPTSALSEAGIGRAKSALVGATNENGFPLATGGERLICGPALGALANRLYSSEYISVDAGMGTRNVYQGEFEPIVWPYLSKALAKKNSFVAQNAATLWVLLRDPARRPAFCVNKVLGYESPQLEQFDLPDEWGVSYRVIYPYGVSVKHWDALVVCKGA